MLNIAALLAGIGPVPEHLSPVEVPLDLHLLLIHHHKRVHYQSQSQRCNHYKFCQ